MKRKNVGIITWHYYTNFGSALQAYALQQSVIRLGCNAKIINYRNSKFVKYGKKAVIKRAFKYKLISLLSKSKSLSLKFQDPYLIFQKKYLRETKIEQNANRLDKLCKNMDAVICGSDQIWAPNVFNPTYMLDFVPNNISKISYAASIGLNDIPEDLRSSYQSLLSKFSAVSVREQAGAELLKNYCNIGAEVVLDPTLLIERSHWETIETPHVQVDGDYVFCYFLNKDHKYKKLVTEYAEIHNLKIVGFSENANDYSWMEKSYNRTGPSEFLWLIHHANAVFTDSYHGTIFSLLYHKDFITFERFSDTDKICQNSRIYQLGCYFGISERIVRATLRESLSISEFDYDIFEDKLKELRVKSNTFLKNSLGA